MLQLKIKHIVWLCIFTMSAILTSCDDEWGNPAPPPNQLGVETENGEQYYRKPIDVGADKTTIVVSPYSSDPSNASYLSSEEMTSAIKVNGVTEYYGTFDIDYSLQWKKVNIVKINENEWECPGLKIKKFVKNNRVYFSLEIEKNSSENAHNYNIMLQAVIKGKNFLGDIYIRQAGIMMFKGRYKRQTYISRIIEDADGNISYEDNATQELIDRLGEMNGIETVVTDDIVYFFDSEDMRKDSSLRRMSAAISDVMPEDVESVPMTRATAASAFSRMIPTALGYGILFDDTDFEDTNIYSNLTGNFYSLWEERDLQDIGMNDKASSLAVYYGGAFGNVTCVLTVWEDKNFNSGDEHRTKHRMSFIANFDNRQVTWSNLKKIPCIGSSNSWNDRISSLSLHFGNYGVNMKDY